MLNRFCTGPEGERIKPNQFRKLRVMSAAGDSQGLRRRLQASCNGSGVHSSAQGSCTMSTTFPSSAQAALAERFRAARKRTVDLCEPLSPEDMMVQSCPEASPAKWHLAHTAWFFESFVLREFLPGYRPFHPDFVWLFNSYYQTFAAFPEKRLRSSFSRPGIKEILRFREHVDQAV